MIKIEVKGIRNLSTLLNPETVNRAAVRSLNETAKMARTTASRSVREKYNITARRLNQGLFTIQGNRRATASNKRAILEATSPRSRPGLQHFAARELRRGGISYQILKSEPRKRLRSAFMATMPNGGTGVFMRYGEKRIMTKGRYVGKKRQPIWRRAGPSITEMFNQAGVNPAIQRFDDNYFIVFERNYYFYLSR